MAEPKVKEQNVIEDRFPLSALLMPREPDPEDGLTFAPAAVRRSVLSQNLDLQLPTKSARHSLRHVGLEDVDKLHATRRTASDAGVFSQLNALGMTAAFFGDERHEENAKEELHDSYEFVPNFSLTLPARVRLEDSPATRSLAAQNLREWPEVSGVALAHKIGIRGAGTLVGVLDTGVDADHQEFAHQTVTYRYVSLYPNSPYWPPRDVRGFDTDGHGTHVSGIIAGQDVGVVPEATLYTASVLESETTRTGIIRVAYGLDWIFRQFTRPDNEHRPAVLNLSLGFPATAASEFPSGEFELRLRTLRRLLRILRQANVLPLIAIGNEGENTYRYPGAFDDVLGVGAVDFEGRVADFSGSGQPENNSKPDLVGYGVGVNSSVERDYGGNSIYQRFNGTSMATPYVTGIAALYRCQQPTLSVEQVWDRLLKTAQELPNEERTRVDLD